MKINKQKIKSKFETLALEGKKRMASTNILPLLKQTYLK